MTELTTQAFSSRRRWTVLTVLCLSLIVVTIDTTILNVALPSLVDQLHASASSLQWIVDAYTVVFAGLLLTAGALGDRFGRRGSLGWGLLVFGLASGGSALATSPDMLIALRALTGIGAALVFPATLSILTNVFPDPVERQRAIAVWAGTAGIGIGLGPVAGGLLLRHFFWGSVFWVNVPVCAIALLGVMLLVPSSRDAEHAPLDLIGAALSIVGLSTLVYAVIEGPARGWGSAPVVGGFVAAVGFLVAFALVELRRRRPMLDLRLFRNPRFTAASLAMTSLYFCLFGVIFFQTQQLQFVLGFDPLGAGLLVLPFAAVLLVVANTTPRLVRWIGTRAVITSGLALVALSMAARVPFTVRTSSTIVVLSSCVFAFGMGLVIAPATASIMGAVPAGRAGVGSAINDTTRQVGGALGVAIMGSVGASLYRHEFTRRVTGAKLPLAVTDHAVDSIGSALVTARGLPAGTAATVTDAARVAFMHGFDVAHLVGCAVAVLGAGLAYAFLPANMKMGSAAKVTAPAEPEAVPVAAAGMDDVDELADLGALATEVDV
ncbi:MAG: drug resistance transporter [Actinomycetia bacterium]|nr:drug resistance transporter [Actinomycetes bacterium]